MTSQEVKLEHWTGPVETLLDLVEEKKMSITEVNLASLTNDFLRIIEQISSRQIADFLVVAAQLILIKSKVLLPSLPLTEEEEEGIKDLENRLRILKFLRGYSRQLAQLWNAPHREFSRPLFKGQPVIFYPAPNITPESLAAIRDSFYKAFLASVRETQTISTTLINLEDKIQEVIERLQRVSDGDHLAFTGLTLQKTKQEIVVLFLAVLHLVERRLVHIEQQKPFGDIKVKHREATIS